MLFWFALGLLVLEFTQEAQFVVLFSINHFEHLESKHVVGTFLVFLFLCLCFGVVGVFFDFSTVLLLGSLSVFFALWCHSFTHDSQGAQKKRT